MDNELHNFDGDLTQDEIKLVLEYRKEKEQTAKQTALFYECIITPEDWALFLKKSKKQPTRAVFFNEFGYKPPVGINSSDVFRTVNKSLSLVKKMVGLGGT